MRVTLIRNATVILELSGRRILVDPMLDPARARPPIENTANPVNNPTVELPFPVEEVLRGVDAVLVTHRHRDHFDGTAERLLPRDVPTFCQPEDASAFYDLGLDVRPIDDALDWNGLAIRRVPGRHGSGAVGEALGPVSGFVLDDLYLAGDTVWYEDVAETIDRYSPRVAIVNAGGASFLEGGLIVMGIDDVLEVASRVPVIVCVHMEALNHCHLSRADLAAAVPGVVIPQDGETVSL
jgi:L-ascorbate metabolism protein UlaG (beta-lactamase superfamily)